MKTAQYSILGMPVWWVYTSPRYALTPGAMPAECWAFQGFPGYLGELWNCTRSRRSSTASWACRCGGCTRPRATPSRRAPCPPSAGPSRASRGTWVSVVELYQVKTKQYSILGMPVWWVYTSPRYALTPGAMPAECWAFQGFPGILGMPVWWVYTSPRYALTPGAMPAECWAFQGFRGTWVSVVELYQVKTKQYSILGMPVWWVYTSPRYALTPGAMPAECWAFQGFPGYLVIRLYAVIEVTGFSLEHMSRLLAVDGKIESAPKNFSGLHGELDPAPHLFGSYVYDANGTAIQYFPVQYPKTTDIGGVNYPVAYDTVELRVESNHGNPTYTCVYRFRVHGNALRDVRAATDDSIRDSET
ncbi:hypothetical protein NE865_00276 [Phthorimaea operculella]|nr:hypothetical protein NE865_00276 [Phthorimaea operculella]